MKGHIIFIAKKGKTRPKNSLPGKGTPPITHPKVGREEKPQSHQQQLGKKRRGRPPKEKADSPTGTYDDKHQRATCSWMRWKHWLDGCANNILLIITLILVKRVYSLTAWSW